jgi:hypothetical protein
MLAMQPTSQAPVATETPAQRKKQLIASLFFLQDSRAVHLDGYSLVAASESRSITFPISVLPEIEPVAADSTPRVAADTPLCAGRFRNQIRACRRGEIVDAVSIRHRPGEAEDRKVPGQRKETSSKALPKQM